MTQRDWRWKHLSPPGIRESCSCHVQPLPVLDHCLSNLVTDVWPMDYHLDPLANPMAVAFLCQAKTNFTPKLFSSMAKIVGGGASVGCLPVGWILMVCSNGVLPVLVESDSDLYQKTRTTTTTVTATDNNDISNSSNRKKNNKKPQGQESVKLLKGHYERTQLGLDMRCCRSHSLQGVEFILRGSCEQHEMKLSVHHGTPNNQYGSHTECSKQTKKQQIVCFFGFSCVV